MKRSIFVAVILCFLVACQQNPPSIATPISLTPKARVTIPDNAFLLDVRTLEEHEKAYIPLTDAVIPFEQLTGKSSELPDDPSIPIVVYCNSGRRSAIAVKTLTSMGYTDVKDLGGILQWEAEGNRVCKTVECA